MHFILRKKTKTATVELLCRITTYLYSRSSYLRESLCCHEEVLSISPKTNKTKKHQINSLTLSPRRFTSSGPNFHTKSNGRPTWSPECSRTSNTEKETLASSNCGQTGHWVTGPVGKIAGIDPITLPSKVAGGKTNAKRKSWMRKKESVKRKIQNPSAFTNN